MALESGTRLGPYEIRSLLGSGGMGEVYRALDARFWAEVAIKVLPEGFASDQDRLRRFEQEARAVAALSHPSILSVFDLGALNSPAPWRNRRRRTSPAHDPFLRGEMAFRRENWSEAGTAYEQAVALDPSYALAWAHLGRTRSAWAEYSNGADTKRAREAAERAIALDRLEFRAASAAGGPQVLVQDLCL